MKWLILGLALAGLAFIAVAWREANIGGDNPTGNQLDRRQAAPFPALVGVGLLVADGALWFGYVMVRGIL